MGAGTAELVPAGAAGAAALTRGEGSGVVALAMLGERDFEQRLTALKLGQERMRRIQKEIMTVDEDYGVIPGTAKPTLLKPGAEKICQVYGLVPSFQETLTTGDGITTPHLRVVTKCYLHLGAQDGPIVGEGVGSANSWERKHRYRAAARSCPACGVVGTIRRSKFGEKGWYCHDKSGGCGQEFAADEKAILEQQGGQVENPDPFDVENTLLKMAEKRAHVDAALRATATSGLFTQDVEEAVDPAPATSGEKPAPAAAAAKPAAAASADAGGNTTVKDVTDPTGEKKPYFVTFADGRKGSTFKESLATHAKNAKAAGALVNPVLEKKGNFTNLIGFDAIHHAAEPAAAAEPDEPVSGPEQILTVRPIDTDNGTRWVIQTDKRQLVTDQAAFAEAATKARADKVGLTPVFDPVARPGGGTINKLTAWKAAEAPAEPATREPGSDDE